MSYLQRVVGFALVLFMAIPSAYSVADEQIPAKSNAGADASVFDVYVAADGNDRNSGLSPDYPVLTLTRAQLILSKQLSSAPQNAIVHIAAGRYRNHVIRWSFSMPKHKTLIIGEGGRPIFDGSGTQQVYWMNIVRGSAKPEDLQNIEIRNLRIQNYFSAIRIGGENTNTPRSKGGIVISGMVFNRIGAAFNPGPAQSHSSIYISNSDNNEIRSNHFSMITNDINFSPDYATAHYGGLHAIYVNRSSGTLIKGNDFKEIYARGVIKFRDFSNYGRVIKNKFYDNTSLVADNYCDNTSSACLSYGQDWNECPSWGVVWQNNVTKYSRPGPVRPTLDIAFHEENEAYCQSDRFFKDRNLDPADPLNQIENVLRLRDLGGNVLNPDL